MAEGRRSDTNQQHEQERLNTSLDYCKHMTTISGAATLALVAVYQQNILGKHALTIALVCFAASAVLAIQGMISTIRLTLNPGANVSLGLISFYVEGSGAALGAALLVVVAQRVPPLIAAIGFLVVGVLFSLSSFLRTRHRRTRGE